MPRSCLKVPGGGWVVEWVGGGGGGGVESKFSVQLIPKLNIFRSASSSTTR